MDSQGPTVVPIAFAFIVGRAIRNYAHWRLQEGEKIGRLDFLYGSTTVTTTLSTMIDLRRFGPLELLLAVIWAFSPLGGQAILRVLSFGTTPIPSSTHLQYVNVTNTTFPSVFQGADHGTAALPVNALFLASMGAPETTRNSPMDTWGNIMVPQIESMPQHNGSSGTEWIPISPDSNNITYASFIGVPTGSIGQDVNSTFNIETSYWDVRCSGIKQVLIDDMSRVRASMAGPSNTSCYPTGCVGTYDWGSIATVPSQDGQSGAGRCNKTNTARSFSILSWDSDSNGTFATCKMTTSYVELAVSCEGWKCRTSAIRPSTLVHPGANRTLFDDCNGGPYPYLWFYFSALYGTLGGFFGNAHVLNSTTTTRSGTPTALQAYIVEPNQALNATAVNRLPSLWTVDASTFSTRLGQLLNSYWLATVATEAVSLGHPVDYQGIISSESSGISFAQSEVVATSLETVVRCNRGWLAPLILSAIVMLASVFVSLWTDARLCVPRILMNVSTMTRGNPNFGLPEGGGALSDEGRSRLMRDIKVRFGDADPWGGTVHGLTIGDCAEAGGRVARVDKNGLYV